jgi:hypothetical protein
MQRNGHANNHIYLAAITIAERRARRSYFDQHVIEDEELGYITIDEGDYGILSQSLIDRIVYTVAGELIDDC